MRAETAIDIPMDLKRVSVDPASGGSIWQKRVNNCIGDVVEDFNWFAHQPEKGANEKC